MYSEQLAVLLFIAATHAAGPGLATQPLAQMPRNGSEKVALSVRADSRLAAAGKLRKQIRREREATMLAEFR